MPFNQTANGFVFAGAMARAVWISAVSESSAAKHQKPSKSS